MKVYVDDQNKEILEDLIYLANLEECDIEIQSLSDYTKEVRKEVVQELKEKLKAKEIFHPEDEFTLDYDFYYKEDVDEILDQIEQGEVDAKD